VETISALLIEDDARLARFTADYLADHGVVVTVAADGNEGLAAATRSRFDVVLLDLMLPGRDGLSVCRALRETSDVPIIMLTARVEEADRVMGLEGGADDYLSKPFSPRELLARIHAQVRRDRGQLGAKARDLRVGGLVVDTASRRVELDGVAIALTTAEFDLLCALARRPGRVLSREQLLEIVKGDAEQTFDRAVDTQVSRLRTRLGAVPGGESLIRTVRGVGYMLAETRE
jgi:DNA-binding response OmpR family regulator